LAAALVSSTARDVDARCVARTDENGAGVEVNTLSGSIHRVAFDAGRFHHDQPFRDEVVSCFPNI
jgi:hypothetical protein